MNVYVPILLDIGNILFFIGSLPQLYRTYTNRHELRDLSLYGWTTHIFATMCFFVSGILTGAIFTAILTGFNIGYATITVYWIYRSRVN